MFVWWLMRLCTVLRRRKSFEMARNRKLMESSKVKGGPPIRNAILLAIYGVGR